MRHNFSEKVKRNAAQRAAYLCCCPDCRALTIGPHTDRTKSLNTGNAGHVNAASPGGPRFDPRQSDEERRSSDNAIWLCASCHQKVDGDKSRYTAEELRSWRQQHEEWISTGGIVPSLPELELKTMQGHAIPETPGSVSVADFGDVKEQSFLFRNCSDTCITTIQARVQLPEPVVDSKGRWDNGVKVAFDPIRPEMRFTGSPNARVTRQRPPLATNVHKLQIDSLAPSQAVELRLFTSLKEWQEHDISYTGGVWEGMNDPPNTMYYIDGTFQYELHGAVCAKGFFAPIRYDGQSREMGLAEVLGDYGQWKIGELSSWS